MEYKFEILGIKSFIENIRDLKINDNVILKHEPNNRINENAIGVYTLDNKKIGYLPYDNKQLDITTVKYKINDINLNIKIPYILIKREYDYYGILELPELNNDEYDKTKYNEDMLKFTKYLERNKIVIKNIDIIYSDENYINMNIKTKNTNDIFYLVSKKYYDKNILKYEEFYENKLIKHNIYIQFMIHRLDQYILKQYKLLNNKKLTFNYLIKNNYLDTMKDKFKNEYFGFNKIKINNEEYNKKLKNGGIIYNHKLKCYDYLDYYNETTIIKKIYNEVIDKDLFIEMLKKCILINKYKINLYDEENEYIYELEIILDKNILDNI
jgi:Fe-S cluster biosynthesis and repair protein YggX